MFDILKQNKPDALNKVVTIPGDTKMKMLGICENDRQVLIIFFF